MCAGAHGGAGARNSSAGDASGGEGGADKASARSPRRESALSYSAHISDIVSSDGSRKSIFASAPLYSAVGAGDTAGGIPDEKPRRTPLRGQLLSRTVTSTLAEKVSRDR